MYSISINISGTSVHRLITELPKTTWYNAMSLHLDTLHTVHVGGPINEFKCNSTKSGRGFDEEYFRSSFPAVFLYPEENENVKGLNSKMSYFKLNATLKIYLM